MNISGTKLIVGIFFAVVGVLMTLANLDLIDADRFLRYWPVVLLLVGLVKLADRGRRLGGVILTVIGASLLAENAGWVSVNIFDLWPLLLIAAGIGMVTRSFGFRPGAAGTADDVRNIVAVLSGRKIAPRNFSGARITAFMGGCELDLTQAEMPQSPAIIETFAMWGGIHIIVPDDWDVAGEVVPIMAGFEIKHPAKSGAQKQLIVRGTVIWGGIEVKRRNA